MARSTVYNNIVSQEMLSECNKNNISLGKEFLEYLHSIDRAKTTISQYENDLKIFWCWNYEFNNNKDFAKTTKREFAKFQNHAMTEWQWSPKRVRRVKSTLSSLSNYIENILDDEPEFEGYKSVVRKIESPVNDVVREKTVFEPEELQLLLDWLVDNKEYMKACVVSLAMQSGRRKSELPRFKTWYFDDKNVMFGSLYATPEKVVTKGRGSRGKLLTLYTFKHDFDPYLKLWMEERERLGIESEWLFPAKENGKWVDKPIPITTLDSWVTSFTEFLGKSFYFHSLRHYWTTQASKSKLPANVIKELCGWNDISLVSLYDDSTATDTFGQYFNENGIINREKKE